MEITLRRTEKKIIVGFYLEPRLWLIDAAPQNAMNVLTEVVFKSELTDSFSIYGQRQGFIVVELDQIFFNDFDGLKATIVVELFNCILFCIYEAMPGIQQRHQIELWHLWLWQDNCLQEIGNIIATQQPFPLYKDYIPFDLVNYYIGVSIGRISNHDYNFRFVIEQNELNKAMQLLKLFVERNDNDYFIFGSLLNKSSFNIQRGDFSGSTIKSWLVIEKLISLRFEKLLKNNDDVNKKRRSNLNDYDISSKIEILQITKNMNKDLYDRIYKVRKARNDFMHNLSNISLDMSVEAYKVARDLLSEEMGETFINQGSYFIHEDLK